MKTFKLSEKFLEKYKNKPVAWGFNGLGYLVYKRTYARPIYDEDGNVIRTEEWWETVKRVVEGSFSYQKVHCNNLGIIFDNQKAQKSAQIMYDKMFNFKFTPPGRGLWMSGTEFVMKSDGTINHGSMALNNCGFVTTENIDLKTSFPFEWTMNALMLGVGVGSDVRGAGKIVIKKPAEVNPWTGEKAVFVIPDSREGWVESLRWLLKAYFKGKPMPHFDYSQIRKAGEPIKGFGGVSSGPEPLKQLHSDIINTLEPLIGTPITESAIVDIMNLIGKCVIAGNVRRSAEVILGDINSNEYINLKNPEINKDALYSHRWASNNSIIAEVGKTDYKKVEELINKNGEPGVFWIDNARKYSRMNNGPDYKDMKVMGVNPCVEITLEGSGELCNLVEVNPTAHDSVEEFYDTLKYAYLYAKSITLINTKSIETNAVMLKNRRIGVSLTGITDAFVKFGRRNFLLNWCDKGYAELQKWDKIYSDWLCIPLSKKTTTVKPSGSVSLLMGVSPGIHYPHSKYYIRRVRIADNSPLLSKLKEAGYNIERDVYSSNTMVVEFPIKTENFKKGKKEVSIWEQLNNAADLQRYWSDNAVSITVTFDKEKEGNQIAESLYHYEDKLKCVSFLPLDTASYEQLPYEEISEEQYEEMISKLKILDLSETNAQAKGEKYCTNDNCTL